MKHDKSDRDLEKKDVNMPGSSSSPSGGSVRRDDLESSEVGASSSSGRSGSSRTGSSGSSDVGNRGSSSSSSSDIGKDR